MSSRIILSFDPGSSLTKVVYQLDCGEGVKNKKHLLLMESNVLRVPLSKVKAHQRSSSVADSVIDRIWVQSAKEEECEVAAVGFLAQQFWSGAQYKELKYEAALYKVLASIGLIVHEHQLVQPIHVNLSCLLPYSEYGNREQLRFLLAQNLERFSFLDTPVEARLELWQCFPESFGMLQLSQSQGSISSGQHVMLMFGHRNTSCLVYERGMLVEQSSMSTELGFYQLVEAIAQRASIQDEALLMQVLYKLEVLEKPINPQEPLIQCLCQSRDAGNQGTEARLIAKAINECVEEYWHLIKNWLTAQLPLNVEKVVIAGGAARYLQKRLHDYFSHVSDYWGEEHIPKIQKGLGFKQFGLDDVNSEALSIRMMDIYGVHHYVSQVQLANNISRKE